MTPLEFPGRVLVIGDTQLLTVQAVEIETVNGDLIYRMLGEPRPHLIGAGGVATAIGSLGGDCVMITGMSKSVGEIIVTDDGAVAVKAYAIAMPVMPGWLQLQHEAGSSWVEQPAHLKRADPTQLQATLAQSEVPDDVSVVVIYPGGMLLHNAEMRQIAVSWAQQRFPEAVLMAVGPDALSVSGAAYSVLHATDILDATSDEELREQLVEVRRRHDLESVLATEQQTLWWCSREEKGDAVLEVEVEAPGLSADMLETPHCVTVEARAAGLAMILAAAAGRDEKVLSSNDNVHLLNAMMLGRVCSGRYSKIGTWRASCHLQPYRKDVKKWLGPAWQHVKNVTAVMLDTGELTQDEVLRVAKADRIAKAGPESQVWAFLDTHPDTVMHEKKVQAVAALSQVSGILTYKGQDDYLKSLSTLRPAVLVPPSALKGRPVPGAGMLPRWRGRLVFIDS
jgi:hypothetical protein